MPRRGRGTAGAGAGLGELSRPPCEARAAAAAERYREERIADLESHMRYHWATLQGSGPAGAIACQSRASGTRASRPCFEDAEEVGDDVSDSSEGPTVLRILLGTHLRRLRESKGITARQAAAKIRASESKISRIELGRNAIREIDVLDLLTLYGVDAREREQLLNLAEQSNKPGWWHRYNDILPDWFQAYVGMEEAARSIRVYEAQFIPGLLQTEEYASAVISLGDFPVDQADRLVVLRKERQRRFRDDRLKLWIVLDEAALRRPVAGRRAQVEQLRYLREVCQSPTLTLQIIPYGAGGHAAPTGFSILRFAERDLPDVVYVENLTSALYLDKQADVDRYLLAMERLSIVAHEPNETTGILDEIIGQLESEIAGEE
jgi:transcriptional regulator with XRE-family HTH domain